VVRATPAVGEPRPSVAAVVLAAAVPFIFLHARYQPSVDVGSVAIDLTDVAIAAATIAALVAGARQGLAPLRRAVVIWIPFILFLTWLVISMGWARHFDPSYSLSSHLASALKFLEYAALAPVVPLAVRTEVDRRTLFWAIALWSAFLSLIALLQFLGVVNEFEGRRPLQREPSYVGVHDLGALSAAALSLALVAVLVPTRRGLAWLAGIAGAAGMVLAAALDSVGGAFAAALTVLALVRVRARPALRQAATLFVIVAVVAFGAVTLRSSSVTAFLRFLGVRSQNEQTATHVQSYAHRTLLGYIGVRIWLTHPITGVGWQESMEPAAFERFLADAHKRFPDEPPAAFPSRQNRWGVQNGIIQALADVGVVGLALLLATVSGAFLVACRVAARGRAELVAPALVTCAWLWVAFAVFTGSGILPALSDNGLLWLAVGLAAALHASLTTTD
jgi:O-antigen ligase